MAEIERIRELIELMKENDLAEISIRNGDEQIRLRRGDMGMAVPPGSVAVTSAPTSPDVTTAEPSAPASEQAKQDEGLVPIPSPMVGTFYSAADPNSPAYVTTGSKVTEDTVVCIVEAMKVFNEIKAEVTGVIEKVLVSNEEGIDYGQPLFLVRPHT